jgi:hypothetical protein
MAEPIPTTSDAFYRRSITIEADTTRQRKESHSRGFTVDCDEPEKIGGDNTAAPPLSYFCTVLSF